MLPQDVILPPRLGSARADESDVVRVRWLGTAGFSIDHRGCVVLIDPYVTRAPRGRCVTGSLRSDAGLVARHAPAADAIIAGHTHFDHVLDVPAIARATGARVFGSRSAAALCRMEGVDPAQVTVVERDAGEPDAEAEVGPFRLRFVPSAHSRFLLGRVPFPGEISDCDQVPLRVSHYRCGAVFGVELSVAGRRIYHVGSADLVEAARPPSGVDLVLCCTAGWTATPRFAERLVRALSPGAIVLSHWDDFFSPLDAPVRALPAIRLPRLVEALSAAAPSILVGTLPLLGEVSL